MKNTVPFPYQQTAQQTIALHPSAGQHRPHVGKLQRSGNKDTEQRYTPNTVRNIQFFINPIQFNRENLGLIIWLFFKAFKVARLECQCCMKHNLKHLTRALWGMPMMGQCTKYIQLNMTGDITCYLPRAIMKGGYSRQRSVLYVSFTILLCKKELVSIFLFTFRLHSLKKYFVSFPDGQSNEAAGQNIKERNLFLCKNLNFFFFPLVVTVEVYLETLF